VLQTLPSAVLSAAPIVRVFRSLRQLAPGFGALTHCAGEIHLFDPYTALPGLKAEAMERFLEAGQREEGARPARRRRQIASTFSAKATISEREH